MATESARELIAATFDAAQTERDTLSQVIFASVPWKSVAPFDERKVEAAADRAIARCREVIINELARVLP